MKSPFEFVKNINSSVKDIMNDDNEKMYQPFLINRTFSYFPDTVFYANEMNQASKLPVRLQYDFYRFGMSKRKRFSPWAKKENTEVIKAICSYYGYTRAKAEEVESLLTDEFKEELIELYKYKNEKMTT